MLLSSPSPSPQPHQNVSSMGTQASPLSGYSLLHAQFLSRSLVQGSEFQFCIFNCRLVFIMWAVRLQLGKKLNSGKMFSEHLLFILLPFSPAGEFRLPGINSLLLSPAPTFLSSCTIFLLLLLHASHWHNPLSASDWFPPAAFLNRPSFTHVEVTTDVKPVPSHYS